MGKWMMMTAAVLGALAVALGAYFAHAPLDLTPHMEEVIQKGLHYHALHSVALLVVGLLYRLSGRVLYLYVMALFLAGIVLFSFSLYLYGGAGIPFFAKVTPTGGSAFIAGWLLLAVALFRDPAR